MARITKILRIAGKKAKRNFRAATNFKMRSGKGLCKGTYVQ
jgi:hypothetical protein